MRLWSIHPKYLDTKGLVALWRESLLAQAVLHGETKGYTNHPQLIRFRNHPQPLEAISAYLHGVLQESLLRGHLFDASKIREIRSELAIPVTKGQVEYEFNWLRQKLQIRDPERLKQIAKVKKIEVHPLFNIIEGEVESWEKISS